ncbi:MAG: transcriptional activator RfaH [Burkholderiales bacterium]
MSAWYAVMCKPRQEALAEANLANQGYKVFLPRLSTQTRRAGKWLETIEPLFPRYLFVSPKDDRQSLAPVRSTLGVASLVKFGSRPASVPSEVVESLRAQHDAGTGACASKNVFAPDTPVTFQSGPFAGMEGIFAAESPDARVFVLLEFLGKVNKVKVSRDCLVPAA